MQTAAGARLAPLVALSVLAAGCGGAKTPYVSLVHRVTGAEVVVRGSSGHVLSSLGAAERARLPASGRLSLGGRRFDVTSFGEPGWAGERLTVWLLEPV